MLDLFTGADGTLLDAYSASWVHHPGGSRTAQLSGNKVAVGTGSGLCVYYWATSPASADYNVSLTVNCSALSNNDGGAVGRHSSSADTCYWAQISGTSVRIVKRVAGTQTVLASVASGLTAGVDATLTLSMSGTTIKALINGVEKLSITDTAISSTGYAGLRFQAPATSITFDNFDCTGMGGGSVVVEVEGASSGAGVSTGGAVAMFGGTATTGGSGATSTSAACVSGALVEETGAGAGYGSGGAVVATQAADTGSAAAAGFGGAAVSGVGGSLATAFPIAVGAQWSISTGAAGGDCSAIAATAADLVPDADYRVALAARTYSIKRTARNFSVALSARDFTVGG